MALSLIKPSIREQLGQRLELHLLRITFDTYATGGVAFDPVSLVSGGNNVQCVSIANQQGYQFEYDYTNKKILLRSAAGTEVGNGVDISAVADVRVLLYMSP